MRLRKDAASDDGVVPQAPAIDRLVLASVNAPYRREIDAATLQQCLASGTLGEWPVHVATFFTDLSPNTILSFASSHGISRRQLAHIYCEMKTTTGESNPDLEVELAPLAGAAR